MLGALRGPYIGPGAWEFNSAFRTLRADQHFKGTNEETQRHRGEKTYKVNRQNLLDWSATYGLNRQTSLTFSVPYVVASRSNKNSNGGRSIEEGSGIGDISLMARRWMLNTERHVKGNFSLGLGIKAPTGDYRVEDTFPDRTTPNKTFRKPVDQSIQVGDGGWGILLDASGFQKVGDGTLFGSALYLANPRDTNGTKSSTSATALPHSVADQFVARLGAAYPVRAVPGMVAALALRAEGVPHGDLFGPNNGARRPALSYFIEPSLVYSSGRNTFSIGVPIVLKRRTFRSVGSSPGANTHDDYQDATLANYIVLASFSRRFGGPDERPIRRLPRDTDARAPAAADTNVACSSCGHGMAPSAKFCSECGAKMAVVAAQASESPAKPAVECAPTDPKKP